jgi:hypothetical protein
MAPGIHFEGAIMMRAFAVILPALLLCPVAAFAAETQVTPDAVAPATLSVEQPVNPKGSRPDAPIIQSISARVNVREANGMVLDIVPDFHFIAPKGNAIVLHREVVDTNASQVHINPVSPIVIPADAQKRGAVISGGWRCNVSPYYVTAKAFIMDADGNRSNEVQYTVHCNGG